MKNLTILPLIFFALTVSSCAVTTAGVKKGDERNFVRSIHDVNAERAIKSRMTRAFDFNLKGVDPEVREGIVVLTGNVPSQKDRIEAERIAWSAQRVDQVGNEILVKDRQSHSRNVKDSFLERSIHTRLTADKYVKARNINVETNNGNVYLLGVARNQAELERIAQIASETKGAREVISYVTVAGIDSKINQIAQGPTAPAAISSQSFTQPRISQTIPQGSIPQASLPVAPPIQQRSLPSFLTQAPQASVGSALPGIPAPSGKITSAPLSAPIPFTAQGPTAPSNLDMGDRVNKEFPTDEELGKFRVGSAGEAVSVIESEPYYIDPNTGKQIPVSVIRNLKK